MKRIYISTKSYEDWKGTMKDGNKQFRDGYSAKSLAECWEDAKGFQKSVKIVFNNSNVKVLKTLNCCLLFLNIKFN